MAIEQPYRKLSIGSWEPTYDTELWKRKQAIEFIYAIYRAEGWRRESSIYSHNSAGFII